MKIRKLIEGKWFVSEDGGKNFKLDKDQSTEGNQPEFVEQDGQKYQADPANPGQPLKDADGNPVPFKEGGDAGDKGFSAAEVEAAAKAVAEKIAEYQKVSLAAAEKAAKLNAGANPNVHLVDPDVKIFATRKNVPITMKKSHVDLVANWFKNFILFKAKGNPDAYYKMQDYARKLNPLDSTTAADGGNLVPTILHNAIIPLIEDMAVVRPNATVLDMTGTKTLDIPTVAGKPVMTINGEALQKGSSSMQFGKLTLTPYTLAAIVPITEELVDYSPFNVVTILSQAFAESMAKAEDKLFTVGSGTNEPTGLDAYTFAKTIVKTNDLSWTDLNAAYFGVTQSHRSRGSWLMSADTMAQIANMVDSQNRPIFDVAGVFQTEGLPSIKGRPVFEQNDIGNKIFFGNLKAYWIGLSKKMTIDIAKEATIRDQNLWERNMIAVRCEEKVDGELSDQRAFSEINGI